MQCVAFQQINVNGSPMTLIVASASSCEYVLQTSSEIRQESPFFIDMGTATLISVAVIAVWATAWVYKALARSLYVGNYANEE